MTVCICMLIFDFYWITIENLLKDFGEFQKPATTLPERPSFSANLSSKLPLVFHPKDHRNLCFFYSCPVTEPDPSLTRTWTDATGTFRVEAQFLELQNNLVQLHKINGVKITVPLQRFSQVDQDYIRNVTSTNSVDGSKNLSYTTNGFDWYEFFVKAGISENDAKIYAHHFVLKKMDSTMMTELDSRLLKDLGVHAEGDIIRIQRAIARTTGRTTPSSEGLTNFTVSDEFLRDFSQTNIKTKSLTKIKEEQDRQKAMELSHEAKAIHNRYASPTSTLVTTKDRSTDPSKLSSPTIMGIPSANIPIDLDRSQTSGPTNSQHNLSSFSEGWMNEIRPSVSPKAFPKDMPTIIPDGNNYYGSEAASSLPSRFMPSSSQYAKVSRPTTLVERPIEAGGPSQPRWQPPVDSSFSVPSPITFDPSTMPPKDSSRVFSALANDPLEDHPMFHTIRPAPTNVTSFPRETRQPSPFGPSLVSAPPPSDVTSFMRVASVSSSQPLIPEPLSYPSTDRFSTSDQTRKWSLPFVRFVSIYVQCSLVTSLILEFQTSTDRYSIFRTVNPHSPSVFDSPFNLPPQQRSTPIQTSTDPWFSRSPDVRLPGNPTKPSSTLSSSTSSGQRFRESPSSSSTPRQTKEASVRRD